MNYQQLPQGKSDHLLLPQIPFLFPNQSIWNVKLQKQPDEPNVILSLRTLQSGTKQLNHAYLA
jgi:hypothetical protein